MTNLSCVCDGKSDEATETLSCQPAVLCSAQQHEVTCCLHCPNCPGTAKAGGGDFVCGKCDGTSMDGRQRYSSKAGATSCSLCPVGGRVNGARTTCSEFRLLSAMEKLVRVFRYEQLMCCATEACAMATLPMAISALIAVLLHACS